MARRKTLGWSWGCRRTEEGHFFSFDCFPSLGKRAIRDIGRSLSFGPPSLASGFLSLISLPAACLSSSLPSERDSTKGWGFVLTNPREYVCANSSPLGGPSSFLALGLSMWRVIRVFVRSSPPPPAVRSPLSPCYRTDVSARPDGGRRAGTLTCSSFCPGPHQPGPM